MRSWKKLLAGVMAAAMVVTCMPLQSVSAAEVQTGAEAVDATETEMEDEIDTAVAEAAESTAKTVDTAVTTAEDTAEASAASLQMDAETADSEETAADTVSGDTEGVLNYLVVDKPYVALGGDAEHHCLCRGW